MINRDFVARLSRELADGIFEGIGHLFKENHAPVPKIVIDPATEEIKDDKLLVLFRYWHSLPTNSGLPSSNAIDPVEMRDALGYVILLEVLDSGWDYRYRVYGSKIAASYGKDLTGTRTSEVFPQDHLATFFISVYRASLALRKPILTDHVPPRSVSVAEWRRLVLPLADRNNSVDRFLVGCMPGKWRPQQPDPAQLGRRQ